MKNYKKVSLTSSNLSEEKLAELRRILPEAFSENKIDWQKLRAVLGDEIDERIEKFSFTWAGKNNAIKNVLIPSKSTLRPVKEESIKFDESENIFIEGDNLEVLKLLQKAYFEKVKIIYIDPPYNTGGDFVYRDDFTSPMKNYLQQTGQIDAEGNKLQTNRELSGRYHSDWLSMMYPRLKLAWNLLREDGAIFVSIDDNEIHHLRIILNEVFGEENFRNIFAVRRYDKNINRQFIADGLASFNTGFEYIVCYSKSAEFKFNPVYRQSSEERQNYGYWKGFWNDADRPTMRYDLFGVTPENGQWKWSKERANKAVKNYQEYRQKYSQSISLEEYWIQTGKSKEFVRRNPKGVGKNKGVEHWIPPTSGILRNTNWTDLLISQTEPGLNIPFDSPKNKEVIKSLILSGQDIGDLVVDFFAGSGTTAQAVFELNKEDDGKRKFILIQLPEATEPDSEAHRAGFKTISIIAKERIRRVIKGYGSKPQPINDGFKVFRLTESNYPENNFEFDPEKSEEENNKAFENYLAKAKQASLFDDTKAVDVVYENIVKEGLSLNSKINEGKIGKNEVYSIADGERQLLVCLDKKIDEKTMSELTSKDYQGKTFICMDSALDDTAKANLGLNVELKTI